ncbi:unnamed protein product, partial [Clavelina lepadiformis]
MKVMKFSAIAYENQLVGVIDHLNNALKEEKAKVYITKRNLRDEVLQHMNHQVVNIERKVARLERREDVLQELYSTKIPLEEDELDEKLQFKPVDTLDYFQRTCREGAKPKPNNCESRKQVSRNRGTEHERGTRRNEAGEEELFKRIDPIRQGSNTEAATSPSLSLPLVTQRSLKLIMKSTRRRGKHADDTRLPLENNPNEDGIGAVVRGGQTLNVGPITRSETSPRKKRFESQEKNPETPTWWNHG